MSLSTKSSTYEYITYRIHEYVMRNRDQCRYKYRRGVRIALASCRATSAVQEKREVVGGKELITSGVFPPPMLPALPSSVRGRGSIGDRLGRWPGSAPRGKWRPLAYFEIVAPLTPCPT